MCIDRSWKCLMVSPKFNVCVINLADLARHSDRHNEYWTDSFQYSKCFMNTLYEYYLVVSIITYVNPRSGNGQMQICKNMINYAVN